MFNLVLLLIVYQSLINADCEQHDAVNNTEDVVLWLFGNYQSDIIDIEGYDVAEQTEEERLYFCALNCSQHLFIGVQQNVCYCLDNVFIKDEIRLQYTTATEHSTTESNTLSPASSSQPLSTTTDQNAIVNLTTPVLVNESITASGLTSELDNTLTETFSATVSSDSNTASAPSSMSEKTRHAISLQVRPVTGDTATLKVYYRERDTASLKQSEAEGLKATSLHRNIQRLCGSVHITTEGFVTEVYLGSCNNTHTKTICQTINDTGENIYLGVDPTDWYSAESYCENNGGTLLNVHDFDRYMWNHTDGRYWCGLFKLTTRNEIYDLTTKVTSVGSNITLSTSLLSSTAASSSSISASILVPQTAKGSNGASTGKIANASLTVSSTNRADIASSVSSPRRHIGTIKPTSARTQTEDKSQGLPTAAYIGIGIGILVVVVVIITLVLCRRNLTRKQNKNSLQTFDDVASQKKQKITLVNECYELQIPGENTVPSPQQNAGPSSIQSSLGDPVYALSSNAKQQQPVMVSGDSHLNVNSVHSCSTTKSDISQDMDTEYGQLGMKESVVLNDDTYDHCDHRQNDSKRISSVYNHFDDSVFHGNLDTNYDSVHDRGGGTGGYYSVAGNVEQSNSNVSEYGHIPTTEL